MVYKIILINFQYCFLVITVLILSKKLSVFT